MASHTSSASSRSTKQVLNKRKAFNRNIYFQNKMKDGRQHFLALSKSDDTQCMKYDSQLSELLSIDYRKFFLTALNYFVLLTIQLLN